MNKLATVALVAAAFAGSTATAFATPIDVGGVVFDPGSPLNVDLEAMNIRETQVSAAGDTLSGYGKIGSINGTDQSVFCPGCNLSVTFTYQVSTISTGTGGTKVVDTGGTIDFWVDRTSSFNVADPATAGVGTLWLALAGHTAPRTGFTNTGTLYSTVNGTVANPTSGSTGFGLVDVTGGVAAGNFDTNTIADGIGGLADFSLNSSFQTDIPRGCGTTPSSDPNNMCHYPIGGQAGLIGFAVPEPGSLAILGVGLLGLGAVGYRRRKRSKTL